MKKRVTILLIGVMPYVASSQTIKFSYDNAGNRIKREIVLQAKSFYEKESKIECFSEFLSTKNIRIYPNPTKGRLKIEIEGYEKSDRCIIQIFTASGQQILSTQATSSWTELDISSHANGIYILAIKLNKKGTSWKVIKK